MIYLAAVVHDKTDEGHAPYVSAPIGPYQAHETEALERGRAFLLDAYDTKDVRSIEPAGNAYVDFMDARALVMAAVIREAQEFREKHDREMSEAAMEAVREDASRWLDQYGIDVSSDDLDQVLEALGVNPGDV